MQYIPLPPTGRTLRLREAYRSCPAALHPDRPYNGTGDRWMTLAFMEGWFANGRAETTKLRRSLAEAAELDAARPIIMEDELLVGQPDIPDYTPEEWARFNELYKMMDGSPLPSMALNSHARFDHICLNYETLLKKGVRGLLDEIDGYLAAIDRDDPEVFAQSEVLEQEEFYECCKIELEALLRLAERYAAEAERQAEAAPEPRRSELLGIAEVLRWVPAYPARTYREALQSMHFYTFSLFGLYPMGRPDRLLLPYYEADMAAGRITREQVQELNDQYCMMIATYVFARAACGFIVGGRDENGQLVENDLTWSFLNTLHNIRMPDPNGALAVTPDTSDDILRYSIEILGEGTTHPAFYNDTAITAGLKEYGVTDADACSYIHTTCAEISVAGKSRNYTTSSYISLPQILDEVLSAGQFNSAEEITDAFQEHLRAFLSRDSRSYLRKIREASRNGLEPMRVSCLIDDCLARGKDVYSGGAVYSMIQPIFIGFSNVVDSLMAIRKLVFEEKRLTTDEFRAIVDADFEGNEPLRQHILNRLPHYGNAIDEVDRIAQDLLGRIRLICEGDRLCGARHTMPGTFTYDCHGVFGAVSKATFDGRKAHTSFADGCCAVQGMDKKGPTALIQSLTSVDQRKFLGGMVVNLKFTKSEFDESKRDNLLRLIRVFMEKGGIETQINMVDRSELEDAKAHPEKHGDLIVRIGGYSDYFVRQIPAMQDEIINRTQY